MKLSRTAIIIILVLAGIETLVWLFAIPAIRENKQGSSVANAQSTADEDQAASSGTDAQSGDGAGTDADKSQNADEAGEEQAADADSAADSTTDDQTEEAGTVTDPKTIEEMKKKLTPEQYNICFLKGTEPPGSGKYYKNHDPGEYHCAVCSQLLFKSDTKFDSGTGWPSFWEMAEPGSITETMDASHGMVRTEVTCSVCGSHLGHVFNDGPRPTGLRYCINSLALEFVPEADVEQYNKDHPAPVRDEKSADAGK